MYNNLGVSKFDDLKTKSLDELTAKKNAVEELLKEKRLRDADKAAKPSFNLENPS